MNEISSDIKKDRINIILFVLFLFCDILTFPVVMLTGSSLAFWIFLISLIVFSTLLNKQINKKILLIFITGTIVFMVNIFLVDYKRDVMYIYMLFIRVGIFSLYFSSLIKNYKILIKYYYAFSLIALLISNLYLNYFTSTNGYMDLGTNLAYIFIGLAIYLYNAKFKLKLLNYFLLFFVFMEVLIFGNRSSLLFCIFVILYFELVKIKLDKKGLLVLFTKMCTMLIIIYILLRNISVLLQTISNFSSAFGINSYTLTKLDLTIKSGLSGIVEQSSGREVLYPLIKETIIESNFLPNGVGYLPIITNYTYAYPHNLFLEITLDFGIFGLIGFIMIFISLFKKYLYISNEDQMFRDIVTTMAIFSFTRLMVSGSYWQEPLLWSVFGLILFYKKGLTNSSKNNS